jgi:hypothetical protein
MVESSRKRVAALRKANPGLTGPSIATILGISRQRVHQILDDLGLPTSTRNLELLAVLRKVRWHLRQYDQPKALAVIEKALAKFKD